LLSAENDNSLSGFDAFLHGLLNKTFWARGDIFPKNDGKCDFLMEVSFYKIGIIRSGAYNGVYDSEIGLIQTNMRDYSDSAVSDIN